MIQIDALSPPVKFRLTYPIFVPGDQTRPSSVQNREVKLHYRAFHSFDAAFDCRCGEHLVLEEKRKRGNFGDWVKFKVVLNITSST